MQDDQLRLLVDVVPFVHNIIHHSFRFFFHLYIVHSLIYLYMQQQIQALLPDRTVVNIKVSADVQAHGLVYAIHYYDVIMYSDMVLKLVGDFDPGMCIS